MKKHLMLMLALALTVTGLTACGTGEVEEEAKPHTLPVEVKEDEMEYYEPQKEQAGLVPPIPLRLNGVSFESITLNTKSFHFAEATPEELLKVSGTAINGDDVKDIGNDDFRFHGFAARSGGNTMFYVEFTKDGELVEEFSKDELSGYEIKGIWTSADLIGDNATYISCGSRIFIGLQKYEIEGVNGKGYTSSFDENMLYYPDVAGWTLGLYYTDGVYAAPAVPDEAETAEGEASETDAEAPAETTAEDSADVTDAPILDKQGNEIPKKYLSELFIFRGDAKLAETGE